MYQIQLKDKERVLSDEELVSIFKSGNILSFIKLVDRYKKGLYRMFYRATRNPADAEDLTQEVFLRVYANLQDFREESSFKTWIYRIAINLSTNYKKSGKFKREVLDDSYRVQNDKLRPDVVDNLIKKDYEYLMREAMESLPPKQRMTLTLKVDRELKNPEIAEIMKCPLGTVKANLFHAVNHIRKTLKENGYEFN